MKLKNLVIPVCSLVLLLPAFAYADKDKDMEHKMMMSVDHMGEPITVDILIGKNVKDSEGRDIGEVETLIINRTGRITHAVLSFGGFMDIGDDLIPIPWSVFELDRNLVATPQDSPLQLRVTKQRLGDAPRINEPTHPLPGHEITKLDQANAYFKDEIKERHKEWKRAHKKGNMM
ncbi:hypothetical protein Tel_12505 [Candidatus Tenderia electrophaga]|jgi:sporulation protein YlmC with PRC-barrel domain|uniref:PRC-barrel domain-containing protein n=1 Tax=Candidatus Tenderia electrophaga TaxID=1748243 RepID=A0A0S2TFF1_9GAMM|nr:hypothetical protein Tel_12505 [Candidatus Tenderia electrophaga]